MNDEIHTPLLIVLGYFFILGMLWEGSRPRLRARLEQIGMISIQCLGIAILLRLAFELATRLISIL